ncbi:MAG: histone family protein [Candidatus Aenigmarchaeota archaeon]|nr:histone family protein [Candidatus Aenigmarchaeota archaeon]
MPLPILPFEKIAKNAGARRMGKDAVEELRDVVEEYGFSLAQKAVKLGEHAGRRTVKEEDVELASKGIV